MFKHVGPARTFGNDTKRQVATRGGLSAGGAATNASAAAEAPTKKANGMGKAGAAGSGSGGGGGGSGGGGGGGGGFGSGGGGSSGGGGFGSGGSDSGASIAWASTRSAAAIADKEGRSSPLCGHEAERRVYGSGSARCTACTSKIGARWGSRCDGHF